MKNILLVALLLHSVQLFSQEKRAPQKSIDLIIGIDYDFRFLSGDASIDFLKDLRNEWEIPSINYRLGLNFNHSLSKSFYLKIGIRLLKGGYETKRNELFFTDGNGMQVPSTDPDLPSTLKIKYKYLFLEAPILLRYQFGDKKIKPFLEAGISYYYFLKHREQVITDLWQESNNDKVENLTKVKLVGIFGIGGILELNQKFDLFSQLMYRYHITKTFKEAPLNEHLYEVGLELGLRLNI